MKEGQAKWFVNRETLNKERKVIIQEVAQDFSEEPLAGVFSSSAKDFEGASIEVVIEECSFSKTCRGKFLTSPQETNSHSPMRMIKCVCPEARWAAGNLPPLVV